MYNQEIKEQFLSEFSGDKNEKSCRAKFEAIGIYEEHSSKDLAMMTIEEVIEAMKYVKARTYGSAFALISQIRGYVKWCAQTRAFNYVNTEIVSVSVDDVDISDYLRKMLFQNEDELLAELRKVRSFDEGYYDVVVMVFSWLGITQDLLMDVKIDDVDFDDMSIHLDGRSFEFSNKLGYVLKVYSKTKKSTRMNSNGLRDVYRDDSYDSFIRKFSAPKQLGKKLTKSQMRDAVYDLNDAYSELGNEPRFTIGNLLASGALQRVYDLEKSGIDVFSIKNKTLVSEAYRTGAKLHEILWLYNNYKRAFNL